MNFPNGNAAPNAQNDTNITVLFKICQSLALIRAASGGAISGGMTFPIGITDPDPQNDTDESLWHKIVQSAAAWCSGFAKSYVVPNAQDSIDQSEFKFTQNLYNLIYG